MIVHYKEKPMKNDDDKLSTFFDYKIEERDMLSTLSQLRNIVAALVDIFCGKATNEITLCQTINDLFPYEKLTMESSGLLKRMVVDPNNWKQMLSDIDVCIKYHQVQLHQYLQI